MTDSEREVRCDPEAKAGISNLLEIMSVATGEPIDALEQRFANAGYGEFKEAVGESVVELLAPIRERFEAQRRDERMGFVTAEAGRFFGAARPRGL